MKQYRFLSLFFILLISDIAIMAQYKLKIGYDQYLSLDPPAGWVTTASWSCDKGLKIKESSEVGAIVTVDRYFTGTAHVTCSYTYTYVGSYDGDYHPRHSTKSYSITCIGGTASISETNLELNPGEKHTLRCKRSDSHGTPEWESSNTKVATVDKNGVVTAVGSGVATITLDPIVAAPCFCEVRVKKIAPTKIELTPNPFYVVENKTKKLSINYTPKYASADIIWNSENENIATVTASGTVKGISKGSTYIIAKTDNGLSAKTKIEVVGAPTAVHLPSNVKLSVGYDLTLKPSLTPSNSEATYRWKSSNTSIATVSSSGKVHGVKTGSVTITVTTDNNVSTSVILQIIDAPEGLDSPTINFRVNTISDLNRKLK